MHCKYAPPKFDMDARLNNFIQESLTMLDDKTVTERLNNSPDSPAVFIYLDKYSTQFRSVLTGKMRECWGHKADYFHHILYLNGEFFAQDRDGEFGDSTDQYTIVESVMDIEENQFPSPDEIKLFFVLNTAEVESIDQFKQKFECNLLFKEIESVNFLSMFVLVEEAAIRPEKIKLRNEIRAHISDSDTAKSYNSVFLLSNQLSGNTVLRGDKEAQNYELLGHIAVISNNDDVEKSKRRKAIYSFPMDDYVALTASYIKYQKPSKAIAITSYIKILEFISSEIFVVDENYRIPQNELINALGIKPGIGFEFVEEKIKYILNELLPKDEAFKYLPNMNANSISIRPESGNPVNKEAVFAKLDAITLGSWTPFYEENFLKVIQGCINDDFKLDIQTKIVSLLSQKFTYPQLAMLMESGVETIIETNRPKPQRTKSIESYSDLYEFIKDSIRADIYDELKDVLLKVVIEVDHKAESCNKSYESLKNELINLNDNSEKADAKSIDYFYGNAVRTYLSNLEITEKLRSEFRGFELDRESILSKLKASFEHLVESVQAYRLSFEEELDARMLAVGQTGALKVIATDLQADDDKIICLKSATKPPYVHGYFLARKQANYLDSIDTNSNSIVDIASTKSAGHIRIYSCSRGHLILD